MVSAQNLIAETEGIARQLASAVAAAGYLSVAVIDPLDAADSPSAFGRFIAEEISGAMVNEGQLRVIDRLSLQRILEEQRLSVSGLVNDADAVQRIGDLAGVEVLIVGTYFVLGSNVRLSLKGLNVQTAESVAAVNATLFLDDSVMGLFGSRPPSDARGSSGAVATNGTISASNFSKDVEYDPDSDTYYIYNLCDAEAWIELKSETSYSRVDFVLTPNSAMSAQVQIYVSNRLALEVIHEGFTDEGRSEPTRVQASVGPNSPDNAIRIVIRKYQPRSYYNARCQGVLALGSLQTR